MLEKVLWRIAVAALAIVLGIIFLPDSESFFVVVSTALVLFGISVIWGILYGGVEILIPSVGNSWVFGLIGLAIPCILGGVVFAAVNAYLEGPIVFWNIAESAASFWKYVFLAVIGAALAILGVLIGSGVKETH